jgi:hypothetical protein
MSTLLRAFGQSALEALQRHLLDSRLEVLKHGLHIEDTVKKTIMKAHLAQT